MASELAMQSSKRVDALNAAIGKFENPGDITLLKQRLAQAKTSWLLAEISGSLNQRFEPLELPPDYLVIATDGSQIDIDRHHPARCCLINIGSIYLQYGQNPASMLESEPTLFSSPEELILKPDGGNPGREISIEGPLLGIKRTVEEFRYLSQLARKLSAGLPALALVDGSLILWGLMSKDLPDFVVDSLLDKGVLKYISEIEKLNSQNQLALASYISFPRSTDVINSLRMTVCPHQVPDCDKFCTGIASGERPCDIMAGVVDRELFWACLKNNQRSDVFISQSKISKTRYGCNQIYFFYIKTGNEIARVEIPEWVACQPELLHITHSLILDQCHKGQGYPIALSEAHEMAVVSGADRQNFFYLVDEYFAQCKLSTLTSAKSASKKNRWI
ncbi:MAG: DNA double-strand break repair nuclease NurA [Dehalococcoidaceae bacterium]|nr:DNA double-strand break repair nuclease NurA [Dehalococcoidaceae bacterium]